MGKDKGNSGSIAKTFDTLVGCAQIVGTVIGVIALIVSFLGLFWAITHQETAIQAVRVISGESTATPMVITLPTDTPLPTYTPHPTHTPYPTYTPYIVPTPEPTETLPTPTPVVVVVTATPTPKPTAPPETPPGSVLSVGETWKQGGMSLKLDEVHLEPTWLWLYLSLTNGSDHPILGSYNHTNFSLEDNLGNMYPVKDRLNSKDYNLEPGKTLRIASIGIAAFSGDFTNEAIEWLIITVDGISSIENAQWKVNVYH